METRVLVGALSNDLFRVASLAFRGADKGASRFLIEAKKRAAELEKAKTKKYIKKIAREISACDENEISTELAEKYLMYGVLLQNYALHLISDSETASV